MKTEIIFEKMGLSKVVFIIGIAVLATSIQSTYSASFRSMSPEDGEKEGCHCSREFNKICASDDKTYDNDCLFNCAKKENKDLEIQYSGECFTSNEIICVCIQQFAPVCGTDNITYASECQLECERNYKKDLELKFRGECSEDIHINNKDVETDLVAVECSCSREYVPICSTNNRTFENHCYFECARKADRQLGVKHLGECENHINKDCACDRSFNPICASDGKMRLTFVNVCMFICAQQTNGNLTVKYPGECNKIN